MPLKGKVAGMCEKKSFMRDLCKTSVSLITGYFYDRGVEIISSPVAIPNAFGIPAIIAFLAIMTFQATKPSPQA